MPEHPTLSTATTTPEILEAAARFCWHESRNGEECPPEQIPIETDILDAVGLDELPADAIIKAESEELLKVLFPDYNSRWEWIECEGLGLLTEGQDEDNEQHRRGRLAAIGWGMRDGQDYYALPDLEEVHKHWCQSTVKARHPLVPIVEAWQNRPREVEANNRPDPIFPGPMVIVRPNDSRAGRVFSPAPNGPTANKGGYFPGFTPGEPEGGPITPALPLALYDLGAGAGEVSQRAAPLALRIFVEACLSVPLIERAIDGPVLLPPERFGDFLKRIYPDGAKNWNHRKLGPILAAFEVLESPQARIPWEGPDGSGGTRRVVVPVDIPRAGRLDDWVRFSVNLPPGSERGPLVDRLALIKAGVQSATRYRLALSLSFWWHDPGRLQFPIGGKNAPWRLPRNGRQYPEVSNAELVAMAFPAGDKAPFKNQKHRAEQALDWLIAEGFAAKANKRRIYPGPKWAGWSSQVLPPAGGDQPALR